MNIQLNKQYSTLVAIEAQVVHLRDFNIRIRKKRETFQNEINSFKKEIRYLQKKRYSSSQITTRRQKIPS